MESEVTKEFAMISEEEPIDTSQSLKFILMPRQLKFCEFRVRRAKDPESREKARAALLIAQNYPSPTPEQHQKWLEEQKKYLKELPEGWDNRDAWVYLGPSQK